MGEAMSKFKSMEININHEEQTFYQYVLNTMSVADFNTLPSQLEASARMTTMRLQKPSKMKLSMIQKLEKVLGVPIKELVDQYEIGFDVLTVREYKQLIQAD